MGNLLTTCSERLSKFTCKSSCQISDGEKEILKFRKTLSFDELVKVKEIIENDRIVETIKEHVETITIV